MARAAGTGTAEGTAVETQTQADGTKVIARNPALKPSREKAVGPIDSEGRFTGYGVEGLTFERRWTTPGVHP